MNPDFIGEDADKRQAREIEAATETAIKAIDGTVNGLHRREIPVQEAALTQLLPAIILRQVDRWGHGDLYEDLNKVVLATQNLATELTEWDDGEERPVSLGCRWSDS
jgi:hypothetical protein